MMPALAPTRAEHPLVYQPYSLPLLPRLFGSLAAQGGRLYDLSPSVFLPLFTGLKYFLPIAFIATPLVGVLASVKITYIAITALALFSFWALVYSTLKRGSIDELNDRFLEASTASRIEDVIFFATAGADLAVQDAGSQTALENAADCGNIELVQALLAVPRADVYTRPGGPGEAVLLAAVRNQNAGTIIQALAHAGVNLDARDRYGLTALKVAVELNQIDVVRLLLALATPDVYTQAGGSGEEALYLAAFEGHTEIVETLVGAGVSINARNGSNLTPLMGATLQHHVITVQRLIHLGADLSLRNRQGKTALILAAEQNQTEIVEALVASGVGINSRDNRGYSALDLAALEGHTGIVRALLGAGADVNAPDEQSRQGLTPLMRAAAKNHRETVQALIAARPNVNLQSRVTRTTALSYAALSGHATVETLIASGADVNTRDNNTWTPLMWAARSNHSATAPRVIQELLRAGANLKDRNQQDETALMIALDRDHLDAARALVQSEPPGAASLEELMDTSILEVRPRAVYNLVRRGVRLKGSSGEALSVKDYILEKQILSDLNGVEDWLQSLERAYQAGIEEKPFPSE